MDMASGVGDTAFISFLVARFVHPRPLSLQSDVRHQYWNQFRSFVVGNKACHIEVRVKWQTLGPFHAVVRCSESEEYSKRDLCLLPLFG